MMMTEKEAAEKWCPDARAIVPNPNTNIATVAFNRIMTVFGGECVVDANPHFCRCIGSACTAWRWGPRCVTDGDEPGRGYCGRAGKPE